MMKKRLAALVAALLMMMSVSGALAMTVTGVDSESALRDWETSLFFTRMEALTGVSVTGSAQQDEKAYAALIQNMLQGKVENDALFKAELTRTQERALLDAGAIIDLAPLMEANMPNLTALLAANPQWREIITLEDGRIPSLPLINESERQVCVWINRAWVDKLGLSMPTTPQELTDVLLAMKAGDPNGNYKQDEIAADMMGVWEMRWLLPYFGVAADDYNIARVDGEAVFAPELPAYRAFIELLCAWKEQGILTDDAFLNVHSSAQYEIEKEENPVAASGLMVSVSPYTHVPVTAMTEYEALLMPAEDGQTVWRDMLGQVWTGTFAVTSACGDPAAMLRWADALYSEEGVLLAYAGVEGEDYAFGENGYWMFKVDTARTVENIRADVLMYTGSTMPGYVPNDFLAKVDSEPDRHVIEQSARVSAVAQQVTAPYALTDAQQKRANELAAQIGALVDKGIARFVTGETPLDDASYGAWLEELRAAGSAELAEIFNQTK